MKITKVRVDQLVIDSKNARRHGDENMKAIGSSLKRFGQVEPLVVQAGTMKVIGGNGRLEQMRRDGETHAYVHLVEMDDTQAAALGIALNRSAELGTWDDAALKAVLDSLPPDIQADVGFFDGALAEALAGGGTVGLVDQDDVPAPPDAATTVPGDIWVLGNHRILCGDCTKADDVAALLGENKPALCVTDPPYGVKYNAQWRSDAAASGHLAYADRRVGKVTNDDRADWSEAWALFPGDVIYSWHPAGAPSLVHAKALQDSGFVLRMQIIWAKSNFPIGRGDYHVRHEPCWYAVRQGGKANRNNDRTQTTLWEINLDKNVGGGHSTQKPVECMARPIRNHVPCDVYEPFSGSGTTIIACEKLGRRCFAIEIEPIYVDVAVRRWEAFTGNKAERIQSASEKSSAAPKKKKVDPAAAAS